MPYIVAGVISNRNVVQVAAISKEFKDIDYSDFLASSFGLSINVIGFDWKAYNFDTGVYAVDPNKSFIVKTVNGKVFKLRFLDYYDEFGQKGCAYDGSGGVGGLTTSLIIVRENYQKLSNESVIFDFI